MDFYKMILIKYITQELNQLKKENNAKDNAIIEYLTNKLKQLKDG